MEYNKLYLKDLTEGVLDRHIPIADSLSSLLSPDPIKGTKSIIRIIQSTLLEFEKYLPLCRSTEISMSGDVYQFKDNYESWVNGKADKLELIPLCIVNLSYGFEAVTSNYWRYERPNLYTSGICKYEVNGFYRYPFYVNTDDNGLPTSDSHIFGIDQAVIEQFYNLFDYKMLHTINSRAKLVNLPMTVDFLSLDNTIGELKELIEDDKVSAAHIMCRWK